MTSVNPARHISPDYRVYDLSGSHYDIGFQLGCAMPRFATLPWWPPSPARAFALACIALVGEAHPRILDEYRGYAEAQGIAYEDLAQGVCRTSLRQRAAGGCTSLAWRRDGRVAVGRNYDFQTRQTTRLRIRLTPDVALATVGMQGSLPGGRYDGVNEHGLFASLHVVMADEPFERRPGVPFHLVPRLVLDLCRSVDDALDLVMRLPHLNAFNYLLADAHGFCAVEAHPDRVRILEPDGDCLVVANHYRHPDMIALQGRREAAGSRRRERRAMELVEIGAGAGSILSDHVAPLCGHRSHHSTLWSLVARPGSRSLAYAPGAPCSTAYMHVDWPARWPGRT